MRRATGTLDRTGDGTLREPPDPARTASACPRACRLGVHGRGLRRLIWRRRAIEQRPRLGRR